MTGEFIRPTDVAELTGLSVAALAQLRYKGRGPRYYKPTPSRSTSCSVSQTGRGRVIACSIARSIPDVGNMRYSNVQNFSWVRMLAARLGSRPGTRGTYLAKCLSLLTTVVAPGPPKARICPHGSCATSSRRGQAIPPSPDPGIAGDYVVHTLRGL